MLNSLPFSFSENPIPDHPLVEKFGCFSKITVSGNKALDSLESDKCWLIDDEGSQTRTEAFEKCAWLSYKRGYNTFGVDGNNTCSSGFVAKRFYRGGFQSDCQEKVGGSDSNVVYYFPGNCFISGGRRG